MKIHAKEFFFNNLEFTISDVSITNPREYWRQIKMLVKENSGCENIPPLANTNNNNILMFSDKGKADIFSSPELCSGCVFVIT